ncbi:DUF7668 domain-containing protein [Streptococcus australis]|uniref:DUF7668 domain-containing protein n=1 Tax=Streptococcus australis TaxID=113107 RepID=A0A4V0BR23_9STRE|nr:hypothetical protein [Streptococcus australis]VTS70963.1 Uncharacterised protein [Streptococcus australis]
MGLFDKYKKEKVIEVVSNILNAIHLKKYEDIKNYVDESEIDDLNEFFGYVEKTLELNDFDTIDEYGVGCNFHPPYEYSQLEIYDYDDQTGFAVDYDLTSNSELVDMVLQVEFLYTDNGYTVRFLNVDSD